jgi:hypothetical protein
MLIGISGKKFSGKDEAAKMICLMTDHNWKIRKFSDSLKVMVSHLLKDYDFLIRWEQDRDYRDEFLPAWGMTRREILQKVGTDAMRNNFHQNVWVISALADYKPELDNILITDVRFPNEADHIKKLGGIVVRLDRPGTKTDNHESETALDNYKDFDHVIKNNGTLFQFQDKIYRFVEEEDLRRKLRDTKGLKPKIQLF